MIEGSGQDEPSVLIMGNRGLISNAGNGMDFVNFLGFIAGALTTVSLLPQVIQASKTKSVKDISLEMFCILAAGIFLWLIYGICIVAYPIIISNSVTLAFIAKIISLKIKYK